MSDGTFRTEDAAADARPTLPSGVIENAVLVEIDERGSQCFEFGSGVTDRMWLVGLNRARKTKLGDRGRLVYRSTRSYGLYWFEPYSPVDTGEGAQAQTS
jgi:hypothetical protein